MKIDEPATGLTVNAACAESKGMIIDIATAIKVKELIHSDKFGVSHDEKYTKLGESAIKLLQIMQTAGFIKKIETEVYELGETGLIAANGYIWEMA